MNPTTKNRETAHLPAHSAADRTNGIARVDDVAFELPRTTEPAPTIAPWRMIVSVEENAVGTDPHVVSIRIPPRLGWNPARESICRVASLCGWCRQRTVGSDENLRGRS